MEIVKNHNNDDNDNDVDDDVDDGDSDELFKYSSDDDRNNVVWKVTLMTIMMIDTQLWLCCRSK